MKLCKDCKYSNWEVGVWVCEHPSQGRRRDTGKVYSRSCEFQRSFGRMCGEDSKLYEPKPTLLQRLKGLFK